MFVLKKDFDATIASLRKAIFGKGNITWINTIVTSSASTNFKTQVFAVTGGTITVTATDFNASKGFFWTKNRLIQLQGTDYTLDATSKIVTIPSGNQFVATDGGSMTSDEWILWYQT
jgi:hypothetical protein